MLKIVEIDDSNRRKVHQLIEESWGASIIVVQGRVQNIKELPGFVALKDNEICGVVTFSIENKQCEIVSLDSFVPNNGVGSLLLNTVIEYARGLDCLRVWLIATNDNTGAIKFYQKRGFDIKEFYRDAVAKAREIKPEIPLLGENGIPMRHELEFEFLLR